MSFPFLEQLLRPMTRFALFALILSGCSSTPTEVSKGTVQGRTFNFVSRQSEPNYADNREAVHRSVQRAITKDLAARGLTRVPSGGDLMVAYLLIKGDNVSTTVNPDYFGDSDDLGHLEDIAHNKHMAHGARDHFEAGTLLIDIVDGKSSKLLKRGYATRPLPSNLPASARDARIQEAVDEILRDVHFKS
jgi:hypothetical protein